MKTFVSDDGALAYAEAGPGSGPLVVLLHSGFADHTVWSAQMPVLAERFHVVALDLRGHGGSANASRPFRPADDVAALVRHLDRGPAVLVGVSFGASVAVETALEHPRAVRAVAISGGGVTAPPPVHDAGDPPPLPVFAPDWPFSMLHHHDPETVRILREALAGTLAKHTADEPNLHVQIPDVAARLGELAELPVLALDGEHESADNLGATSAVTDAVKDGRRVGVPGAMHLPNMENPEAYNTALLEFLDSLP